MRGMAATPFLQVSYFILLFKHIIISTTTTILLPVMGQEV